jgi:hypothetical protein
MSGSVTTATQFTKQHLIVQALEAVCPEWAGKIEIRQENQNPNSLTMKTYHGTAKADVVIRSGNMQGQNQAERGFADMGLRLDQNTGSYVWDISDVDRGTYQSQNLNETYGKYGQEFEGEVASAYAALDLAEQCAARGARAVSPIGVVPGEYVASEHAGKTCFGVLMEIDEDQLRQMGIAVPAAR